MEQLKNPSHFRTPEYPPDYDGCCFTFKNVEHFIFSNLTVKDPVVYACTLDTITYFTVENIRFDFNLGNPRPVNMDGIHINGNCRFGQIRNLQGTCYDDLVALNADEGSDGPISHIDIRGIYAEGCHSAVRFLTVKNAVTDITVSDVHGTYYQYCIGLTKYYEGETAGYYDGIVLENIFASKSPRYDYLHISVEAARTMYVFPLIWVEDHTAVRSLTLKNLHRRETCVPVSTLYVGHGSTVDVLSVSDCRVENRTDKPLAFLDIRGQVNHPYFRRNRLLGTEIYEQDSLRLPAVTEGFIAE